METAKLGLPVLQLTHHKSWDWKSFKKHETKRLQKVHAAALFFLIIGLAQLFGSKLLLTDEARSLPLPSFMWILVALVCLVLIVYSELHDKFPVNWTLAFVANLSMTLSVMGYSWSHLSIANCWKAVAIVLVLNFTINFLALYLPVKVLPGFGFTLTATILFVIGYTVITIVVFALSKMSLFMIVDTWCLIYMCLLMFYAGTLINNRHYENFASQEYILSAAFIAHFFFYQLHLVASIIYNYVNPEKTKYERLIYENKLF